MKTCLTDEDGTFWKTNWTIEHVKKPLEKVKKTLGKYLKDPKLKKSHVGSRKKHLERYK